MEKFVRAGQPMYDSIIERMRFACWIAKAADTHSGCVILIAFSQQQWLRERAPVLLLFLYSLSGISCTCRCKWLTYVLFKVEL